MFHEINRNVIEMYVIYEISRENLKLRKKNQVKISKLKNAMS